MERRQSRPVKPTEPTETDPLAPLVVLRHGTSSEAERQAFLDVLQERNVLCALLVEQGQGRGILTQAVGRGFADIARARLRALREGGDHA